MDSHPCECFFCHKVYSYANVDDLLHLARWFAAKAAVRWGGALALVAYLRCGSAARSPFAWRDTLPEHAKRTTERGSKLLFSGLSGSDETLPLCFCDEFLLWQSCVSVTYCTIIALVGERGDPFTCEERCGAPLSAPRGEISTIRTAAHAPPASASIAIRCPLSAPRRDKAEQSS
jgi:hypothetical protein